MDDTASHATLESLRAAIAAAFPRCASARFRLLTAGWDSLAVEVDDRLIFKFPRHAEAERRLRTEAGLLAAVRPAVTMRVPDLALHAGPPLFSFHPKLAGEHLLAEHYAKLAEDARQRLAAEMGQFFAELHALDPHKMQAAGAGPIGSWLPPDEILRQAWPLLPPELHLYAKRTIAAWQDMPTDPLGTTYGFFDGHGWNMASDHAAGRLNGIYDFGDSGFGPLHHEFIQTSWVSPDLTERIVAAYEGLTGRRLDRARIALITGVLRLSELGGLADDPQRLPAAVRGVAEWAAYHRN